MNNQIHSQGDLQVYFREMNLRIDRLMTPWCNLNRL